MTTTIAPDELDRRLKADDLILVDVRRRADRDVDPAGIPGATWRDPEGVGDWSGALPQDRQVVVYCVKGGSVSRTFRLTPTGRIDYRYASFLIVGHHLITAERRTNEDTFGKPEAEPVG
jgi:hypothetical protein